MTTYRFGSITSTDTALTLLATLPIASDTSQSFTIEAHGYMGGTCGVVRMVGAIKNIAGTTTILGTPTITTYAEAAAATWTGSATAAAANLLVHVQGGLGQTVVWTLVLADLSAISTPPPGV